MESTAFRTRAALQLEILALRHQIGVLQRSANASVFGSLLTEGTGLAVFGSATPPSGANRGAP